MNVNCFHTFIQKTTKQKPVLSFQIDLSIKDKIEMLKGATLLSDSAARFRRSMMRPRTCAMVSPVRVRQAVVAACLMGKSMGQPPFWPIDSDDDDRGSRGGPRRRPRGSVLRRPRRRESCLRRRDGRFNHHSPPLPMAFILGGGGVRGGVRLSPALVDATKSED
jgi:hypothetical protein